MPLYNELDNDLTPPQEQQNEVSHDILNEHEFPLDQMIGVDRTKA